MSRRKIAYFDCIAGASGDMILGALVDAGLPADTLRNRLDDLHLDGFELRTRKVSKNGFQATKVDVVVEDDATVRHLPQIVAIIEGGDLSRAVKDAANAIFHRIVETEAGIHGTTIERAHLHELGGVDTIVDVVGALIGLEELGVEEVFASPLPVGRGFVSGAHGQIPLPAPATLGLLRDVPLVGTDIEAELVTPTGAALLSSLSAGFGPIPAMSLEAVGYGAGTRDLKIPNVLRVLLGHGDESAGPGEPVLSETLSLLETNIDDQNPEWYDHATDRLFAEGALDVWLTPAAMKKNRPGTLLSVLCRPGDAADLTRTLFLETSTLGVRESSVTRRSLPRSEATVETSFGPARVKVAHVGGGSAKVSPEYEDCRRLAARHGVPLREIYREVERAAAHLTDVDGSAPGPRP
ncbi:MAG: nickel pincer cofactor biosynthesis protein LarC [Gemmatimonadota bacterium]